MDFADKHLVRNLLGALLSLLELNAFGRGYYGMAGAKNISLYRLKGSPFNNYFLPGLFLFVVVGGSALIAALAVFRKWQTVHLIALACSVTTILWIAIQVSHNRLCFVDAAGYSNFCYSDSLLNKAA